MRQRVVRLALVAGVTVLALLLLVSMCDGGADTGDGGGKAEESGGTKPSASARRDTGSPGRPAVPAAYDTDRGWEVSGVSAGYAVARDLGLVAYLEALGEGRYRLRTLDATTGERGWAGPAWSPRGSADSPPHLLTVTKDGLDHFVVWTFGKGTTDTHQGAGTGTPGPEAVDTAVVLDMYAATDGSRRRAEVPWPAAPSVSGTGPGVLITDGGTANAVVDPVTGAVSTVKGNDLRPPKDCAGCRRLTEVRGVTGKGLLVSGSTGFWVRGGWASRKVAPAGADRDSGVPTSVVDGYVLARWRVAKGGKGSTTHDIWSVHESRTGRALVSVRCHKPEIEPGTYPQAVRSSAGGHLVAGNLAFDLTLGRGRCHEREDGTTSLTLTAVTDAGVAYGTTGALAGTGTPLTLDLAAAEPEPLPAHVRVPEAEVADVGLFTWTDPQDRRHLMGSPRRPDSGGR
ncbi:hypothetical protein J7E88_14000 [Streptomyces sp. ISL-10]|uniref:hypothetical protein n=1 Tax=Streptomyces sp. ISL-10 TaxID=2819172 RepID=UPI001BEBBEAD|nr:hypothetical protein [Streptomyces sp. ISL-10]MBT2366387.1 hypothetical protein [Streptomyces sp. ISL-10]